MIDCWSVLAALREYYSPAGEDEELIPLCSAASSELTARMKPQADCADIRLINAAAAMVNYRLCIKNMHSEQGMVSFKAGDVSVSVSPSALEEMAEKERSSAMLRALPLLTDDEFVFRQVII